MTGKMTLERATEFGAAWNSHNADLVVSFFAEDGAYHASVGPDALGKSYFGKAEIRRGVQAFFDRFPGGKFENLKVVVAGDIGTFEWDFVARDASGQIVRTAGCDLLEFAGDRTKLIAFADPRSYAGLSVSPDERWLIYNTLPEPDNNDLMLVENFK